MHCGLQVCFDDCCKIMDPNDRTFSLEVNRVRVFFLVSMPLFQHAESCTGGTAVYLALNSAVIVIIKARTGAVWGSIYLDAHGEEDRNLRRGTVPDQSFLKQKFRKANVLVRITIPYPSERLHRSQFRPSQLVVLHEYVSKCGS